tara:strand:+ start:576 stop:1187 length:612 start_codon:yes stop_codon:yes gene_type:complete
MSNIKLVHSGGNSVSLTTPDNNPSSNITFKLPQADASAEAVLKTDGSGALSFNPVEVDQWYLNQNATAGTIPGTYWTRKLKIGTGMTVSQDANGRWVFPSTGIWRISFAFASRPDQSDNVYLDIYTTADSYSSTTDYTRAQCGGNDTDVGRAQGSYQSVLFDVENTSTHGLYFVCGSHGGSSYTQGTHNPMTTTAMFERMGDT